MVSVDIKQHVYLLFRLFALELTLQFSNFLYGVFFCGNIMNFGEMRLCELREECRKQGAKVDGRCL